MPADENAFFWETADGMTNFERGYCDVSALAEGLTHAELAADLAQCAPDAARRAELASDATPTMVDAAMCYPRLPDQDD